MTNAELLILGLVSEQPRHGYEIEQVIETRGMREWTDIGFSSIYYLLKKIEDKGFVVSKVNTSNSQGPSRKVYHATVEGRNELHQKSLSLLQKPVSQPSPFLMGLSVFPIFTKIEKLSALRNYVSELEERKHHLQKQADAQKPLPTHVKSMFEYSHAITQAEIDAIERLIQTIVEPQEN